MKKFILFTSILSTSVLAATEFPQLFIGVKGELEPVESNADSEGRAKNRELKS